MALYELITWVVVLMAQLDNSSPFLLDKGDCLAYPPCACNGIELRCSNKGLTEFPKFKVVNVTGSDLHILLNNNDITTIPSNAFLNLTVSNMTKIAISLQNNNLNVIAPHAFNGIAEGVKTVILDNNNFTSIPSELGQLSNLHDLYFDGNPISTLSSSSGILHTFGRYLHSLHLDLQHFQAWPRELNNLRLLAELHLTNVQETHLNYDSFDTFGHTLTALSIRNSQLEKIPVAICHLQHLQSLWFTGNTNVQVRSTVLEPCSQALVHAFYIDLDNNSLIYMPDVFKVFPSVTTLLMRSNRLSFIPSESVPSNSSLLELNLANNEFTRISSAINKLTLITLLDMSHNKITSIEDSDLNNLNKLHSLVLNSNPIEYISSNAFSNNRNLFQLSLKFTKLRHIPVSLTGLSNVRGLDLVGSPIECSCNLAYLKSWDLSNIDIGGNCVTSSLSLITFLREDLPTCP